MEGESFHTFSEYMNKGNQALSASMEDYLEMIYRLSMKTGFTRIHELSKALHVQPPSATKMVQRLALQKLVKYEKYGVLILEEAGKELGGELLLRHNTLENLFAIIGVEKADLLDEVEKTEHTVSRKTLKCFDDFVNFIRENPDIPARYSSYRFINK